VVGKVMQKVGSMMHNEGMVEKGKIKREEKMSVKKGEEEEMEQPPFAN
jgi:hypothetical protein